MPLKGTRVIPAGWAEHHRPTTDSAKTATVDLRHKRTTRDPETPYATDLPARIQVQDAQGWQREVVTDTVTVRGYLVSLPGATNGVQIGDSVDVKTCHDPDLIVGKTLLVRDVIRGSERFDRDLFCTLAD